MPSDYKRFEGNTVGLQISRSSLAKSAMVAINEPLKQHAVYIYTALQYIYLSSQGLRIILPVAPFGGLMISSCATLA